MKERMAGIVVCVCISMVALCIGLACGHFTGHVLGIIQGRAEMKRWQDEYYAHNAPQNSKCEPPFSIHVELREQAIYWVCVEEPVIFESRGLLVPPPKPQKGSKRPARGEPTWDGPAQMHIYYKGQSFTIPEALKKGLIEIGPAQPEKELAPEFDSNAPAPQTAEKP